MPIQKHIVRVLENKKVDEDTYKIKLNKPDNSQLDFIPGQFITIEDNFRGQKLKRAYSIASKAGDRHIELLIKSLKGRMSEFLINNTLKIGREIIIVGPLGGFSIKDENKESVFVCNGVGIAPFLSMIPYLLEGTDESVVLLAGFKDEKSIIGQETINSLIEKYPNFRAEIVLSNPINNEHPRKGRVQQHLLDIVKECEECLVYICGINDMVSDCQALLLNNSFPRDNIIVDNWN